MTRVRVGIVSWNTATLLDRCLGALSAALEGLDAEVVVVDNASSDDSVAVARAHDGVVVVVNEENVGYARAMNRALSGDTSDVLIALNPDTEPAPRSLTRLVHELLQHPDTALIAPRLEGADGNLQHSAYRFPSLRLAVVVSLLPTTLQRGRVGRRWYLEGASPHDTSGEVDWAIGAVHCIRAAAITGDPPYSERWFMYAEDLELCWRLRKRGWAVRFTADVTIRHVGNAAGLQAWGDTRTLRYMDASYDWYRAEMGAARTRLWAALNAIGTLRHLASLAARRLVRSRAPRWASAKDLRLLLRLHARNVLRPGAPSAYRTS